MFVSIFVIGGGLGYYKHDRKSYSRSYTLYFCVLTPVSVILNYAKQQFSVCYLMVSALFSASEDIQFINEK